MKAKKMLLIVSAVLLALTQVGGWAQGKYVPKADEELFGTWTNGQNAGGIFQPQKFRVHSWRIQSLQQDIRLGSR